MSIQKKMELAQQGYYTLSMEEMVEALRAGLVDSITIPNGPAQGELMKHYTLLLAREGVFADVKEEKGCITYQLVKKVIA